MKLNTENTNCFVYPCGAAGAGETEESATADRLLIELLGEVRVEGLDRMRVNMKVSVVNRKYAQYTSELAWLNEKSQHGNLFPWSRWEQTRN